VQAAFSSIGAEDRLSNQQGHHPLLLAPDAFHVGVLFQPTLAFLDRMVEILPAGVESARPASAYLEEFVLNVYLPQLQEKVHNLFHLAISGVSQQCILD
jgi:exocyst complex component 4